MNRHRTAQRGTAALELAIVAPAIIVLALVAVLGGRITEAESEVYAAANAAARAGTLARTAGSAGDAARDAAAAQLADHGLSCTPLGIGVDTSAFHPGGWVTADVRCAVPTTELVGIGLPWSVAMRGHSTSPVDIFRGTR